MNHHDHKAQTALAAARQAQDTRDFASEIEFLSLALNVSAAPPASPLRAHMLACRAAAKLHVHDFKGACCSGVARVLLGWRTVCHAPTTAERALIQECVLLGCC